MQILLSPNKSQPDQLRLIYARAIREATELYIASAYLTDWNGGQAVGKACKQIVFIVGTDFGLSRKAAMRNVLRWMPKRGSCLFLAAPKMTDGGFHPKIVAWRSKGGRCYTLTGSSNLSKAAFGGNYEANAFCEISTEQFRAIVKWLEPLFGQSVPVTEDWIENHYKEASLRTRGGSAHSLPPTVKLTLPKGPTYVQAVRERRKQQAAFQKIRSRISAAVRQSATGKIRTACFGDASGRSGQITNRGFKAVESNLAVSRQSGRRCRERW